MEKSKLDTGQWGDNWIDGDNWCVRIKPDFGDGIARTGVVFIPRREAECVQHQSGETARSGRIETMPSPAWVQHLEERLPPGSRLFSSADKMQTSTSGRAPA